MGKKVYLVDGVRTPFIKARGKPGAFTAADLGTCALQQLLLRNPLEASEIDEVIVGCVAPKANEANLARIIAKRSGCDVPAWTVVRNCGSGMQAIDSAIGQIQLSRAELMIAGGVDALSQTPLLFRDAFVDKFANYYQAKSLAAKLKAISKIKLKDLMPISALVKGLNDPLIDEAMGHTAENLAKQFAISRKDQDSYAVASHKRLAKAIDNNQLTDVMPITDSTGKLYASDDGLRKDSSMDKLNRLKPYFDRKYGTVTPGNSSQITDGGVMLLLASEEAVNKYNLNPRAVLHECHWTALDPAYMGLGPAYSIAKLLQEHNLALKDIDYWEINEAFAAQVLAVLAALNDHKFCQEKLLLKDKLGLIPREKLNIYGGAISCGHPMGASGARIVLQLLEALEHNQASKGIASQCIGGGQGGAILIERLGGKHA